MACANVVLPHKVPDTLLAGKKASTANLLRHSWTSVGALEFGMDGSDQRHICARGNRLEGDEVSIMAYGLAQHSRVLSLVGANVEDAVDLPGIPKGVATAPPPISHKGCACRRVPCSLDADCSN